MACLWYLLLSVVMYAVGGSASECDPSRAVDLKLSIKSRLNQTGHLVAQVMLEDGSGMLEDKKNYWEVNFDHDKSCSSVSGPKSLPGDSELPKREIPGPFYQLIPKMGYYKLHNQPKKWFEAKYICQKEGAHLGILNSQIEFQYVKEMWNRLPKLQNDWRKGFIFLGVSDTRIEKHWETVLDEPFDKAGYYQWGRNEPDGGTRENCMAVYLDNGNLVDTSCEQEYAFFCENTL
ncbi:hemolymph lipopolysaccharide-binding protein-like isoform X2 [Periplaneta americana]|uniref:hemolymph lipopolysaccharide-binding protein-like isoform X2 n=1 Tax=Periplaneta americana TaxID=6978 RepID=UPI0037E7077D